ncbi:MAG: copper-binding protein [Rhizobiaceae bacterium]|nr:copper-binding protein [Rhizobiaceae bacterium]
MLTRRTLVSAALIILGTQPVIAKSKNHHILIQDFQFSPKSLNVRRGDTVVFTNKDVVPHTATAVDLSWDSGDLKMNAQWSFTAVRSGELEFFCVHHPVMRGRLIAD